LNNAKLFIASISLPTKKKYFLKKKKIKIFLDYYFSARIHGAAV